MPAPKKPAKSNPTRTAPTTKAKAEKPAEKKAAAPPAPSGVPGINPAASAAHAAAMVAQNAAQPPAAAGGTPQPESAMFRNLKGALNKPHSQIMGGLLDKLGSKEPKKSSIPFAGGKQVGRDQTIGGGDPTRRGVPRRTGG